MSRISMTPIAINHRDMDMLLADTYAKQNGTFKGCSVGCFLHDIYPAKTAYEIGDLDGKHKIIADHFGYPEWLVLLQDNIFEGLPETDRGNWHVNLAKSIDALASEPNWQVILHKVHVALLKVSYANAGQSQNVVQSVIDLHERAASGEVVSEELWSAAYFSADYDADYAARSAARSAAWSAARSAADYAAYQDMRDGVLSAYSAARSAAWSAAYSAAYQDMRDGVLSALDSEKSA